MNQDPTNNKPAEGASEKTAETDVRHIEWILTPKKTAETDFTPEYGDLSLLNETGILLSAVGRAQLRDMATEYLDLLETSTAIYEVNGDYALGLFSSGWCRMMDTASRRLCHTNDNRAALNSGKWLCHESCWQEASLPAIKKGQAVDVACKGGIRLYAVPIWAGGEVVGAINFGYGDPPTDEETLQALAEKYRLSIEELRKQAQTYQTRPRFIIDYARERIQKAALYLGYIIETKQAEDELRRLKAHLETEVAEKTRELKERVAELERFRDATIEREFRIKELRDEIARLKGGTS